MWSRQVRTRSAQNIFQELEHLNDMGIRNIMFHADTFTINRNIVLELCQKITHASLPIRWICNSRVDTVDPKMLHEMKRAGCWMIAYGIETGSDEILDNVKKGGSATVDQARKAVAWTKEAGIKVWAYFVMGLPGENVQTVEETIRFAKSIPADIVNFAVGTPYPGTDLHKQAISQGLLKSEYWEDFDQNYSAILSYPNFSSDDIVESVRQAYRKWYLRPRGLWAFFQGIKNYGDAKTLVRIGWDHIRISKGRKA